MTWAEVSRIEAMTPHLRRTGLAVLSDLPWGSHLCHFYQTQQDLLDTLVPYFKVGLEAKELCVWVLHESLTETKARRSLQQGVPGADSYLADGSIELFSSAEWYLKRGVFSFKRVMRMWDQKLDTALARGYAGLRVNGNTAWLERKHWSRFSEYEAALNDSLAEKRMLALCSYHLAACGCTDILDVARTHHFALARRNGRWDVVQWRHPPTSPDLYGRLTTREREVLLLAAEGHSNQAIARRLSIGVRTVESHRASLMRKLGLRNQTELVRYALQRGLLPL
jgi:DNA-binding CsgD family transcriptional regulator